MGQRNMVAGVTICCPTCGGPWKATKRVCRQCGQPIAGRHKWHMIPAGPGTFTIEHRNCADPASYQKSENPK